MMTTIPPCLDGEYKLMNVDGLKVEQVDKAARVKFVVDSEFHCWQR